MPDQDDAQHVVVRLSNSQTALLAGAIIGNRYGKPMEWADAFLVWLRENQ